MNKSICVYTGAKNKRYLVKKPSIACFFVSQSRLTDAVSVILSELLSYEHPAKAGELFCVACGEDEGRAGNVLCLAGASERGLPVWVAFREAVFGEKGRAAVRAA